ncbi:hypothetical protein OROGR_019150 [Orobanche gracilis]
MEAFLFTWKYYSEKKTLVETERYNVKETQVTNIFRDLEESNVLRSYMSDAIEDISKACVALELKEAAPQIAVGTLQTLLSEIIRISCPYSIFTHLSDASVPKETKSEDSFMQLQEIQESARLAFSNCFLDFVGNLERIGVELGQHKSDKEGFHLENGYAHALEEKAPTDLQGGELSYELYGKYRHIWQHSRGKDEGNSDV